MAAPAWNTPAWIDQSPAGVSYASEIHLLEDLSRQAAAHGCRVVPEVELDFDARQFADLVIERLTDGSRLLFGLIQKSPTDAARIDVLSRPDPGHAILRLKNQQWRLILASTFLHPDPVDQLGLAGLLRILLDERE